MPTRGGTYLLTWTTHGSWLPGDGRGFVSRVPVGRDEYAIHNELGTPQDADMPLVRVAAETRMHGNTIVFSRAHARCCRAAFEEVAERNAYVLHACAVMSTHVHIVLRSDAHEGSDLLRFLKGVSARRLTQAFGHPNAVSWWTRHGSKRLLTTSTSRTGAVRYTLAQDRPLEMFGTLAD